MTDFDARLQARMQRLDAAIPAPQVANPPRVSLPRRRPPNRRRQGLMLLAATVVLLFGAAFVAYGGPRPMTAAEESALASFELWIDDQLLGEFPADECVAPAVAKQRVRTALDRLGLQDWTIRADADSLVNVRCTSFGASSADRFVMVLGALDVAERPGGAVSTALADATATLLRECLDRDDAVALVETAMRDAGATDFIVHADPFGPQGMPLDKADEYLQHVEAGCFVLVPGIQRERGTSALYLWGKWQLP